MSELPPEVVALLGEDATPASAARYLYEYAAHSLTSALNGSAGSAVDAYTELLGARAIEAMEALLARDQMCCQNLEDPPCEHHQARWAKRAAYEKLRALGKGG